VFRKFSALEFFITNLTLDHNFWADVFDMFSELSSGQILIFLQVTNIAAKLGALVQLYVLLKLIDSLPRKL